MPKAKQNYAIYFAMASNLKTTFCIGHMKHFECAEVISAKD